MAQTFHRQAHMAVLVAAVAVGLAIPSGRACSVPVFRYALERWTPDLYEVIVLHKAPLDAAAQDAVARLQDAVDNPEAPANLHVIVLDLSAASSAPVLAPEVAAQEQANGLPRLLLRQPGAPPEASPVWSAPLSAEAVGVLLESSARRELVRVLGGGWAVAWVFLECGDKARDDAARTRLTGILADLAQAAPAMLSEGDTAPSFPVLSVAARDPAEAVLVRMLLATEADLARYTDQPMAFPVFGRGRVLWCLVGRGMTPDNLRQACEILLGACSCELKDDNPGVDLLLTAAWDRVVDFTNPDAANAALTASPLASLDPDLVAPPSPDPSGDPAAAPSPSPESSDTGSGGSRRLTLAVVGMVVLAAAVVGVVSLRLLAPRPPDPP
jgi:hypothetical protein